MSKASLQLATAIAIKHLIDVHGVDGTGAIIGSGGRTTVEEAQFVAELIATGGDLVARAAETGAKAVSGGQRQLSATSAWVNSSVASLRSRLPSLNFNPWSSTHDEHPTSLMDHEAPEQGRDGEVEEESNVPWTSNGRLPFLEGEEAPLSLFGVGSASDDTESIIDELERSTIIWGND
jgi:hypothetical protein